MLEVRFLRTRRLGSPSEKPFFLFAALPHEFPQTLFAQDGLNEGGFLLSVLGVCEGQFQRGERRRPSTAQVMVFAPRVPARRLTCPGKNFGLGPPSQRKLGGKQLTFPLLGGQVADTYVAGLVVLQITNCVFTEETIVVLRSKLFVP